MQLQPWTRAFDRPYIQVLSDRWAFQAKSDFITHVANINSLNKTLISYIYLRLETHEENLNTCWPDMFSRYVFQCMEE